MIVCFSFFFFFFFLLISTLVDLKIWRAALSWYVIISWSWPQLIDAREQWGGSCGSPPARMHLRCLDYFWAGDSPVISCCRVWQFLRCAWFDKFACHKIWEHWSLSLREMKQMPVWIQIQNVSTVILSLYPDWLIIALYNSRCMQCAWGCTHTVQCTMVLHNGPCWTL